MKLLPIGELAATIGVSVATLRRWDHDGKLKPFCRSPGGHRRYDLTGVLTALGSGNQISTGVQPRLSIGYSRVSGHDQKADLLRQAERLQEALAGEPNSMLISDLGSGLNFKKRGLSKLLGLILSGQVAKLYITHKDRLLRFGYELIEAIVRANGGEIVILGAETATAVEDDLAKDVLAIITVFSAKLYGRRSHQNRHRQEAG